MLTINEKIKYIGIDANIKISLDLNNNIIGQQQEINKLTEETIANLINPIIDLETRRFQLDLNILVTRLKFYFNDSNLATFVPAGFTIEEVLGQSISFRNSFFVLDYYDTYDPFTQTKIFTTYITKLGIESYYFIAKTLPNIRICDQIYYWYVPNWYIESQTGETKIGYVKFSFYNAKTGKISLFKNYYNSNNPEINQTPKVLYFKTELNLINRSWKFLEIPNQIAIATEITNNVLYSNRVNNTLDTIDNIIQTYPTGDTYNYETNTYFNIDNYLSL